LRDGSDRVGAVRLKREGSGSFLEKRTKKLYPLSIQTRTSPPKLQGMKFFASFFQKRSLRLPCLRLNAAGKARDITSGTRLYR
jgi:hypothetical protein